MRFDNSNTKRKGNKEKFKERKDSKKLNKEKVS